MHLYYEVVQKFLAYNKGLLVNIDKIIHSENIDLCEQIYRFIDACRITWQVREPFDVICREFPEFFYESSLYQDEIIAIENYFLDGSHRTQPYYLYERF